MSDASSITKGTHYAQPEAGEDNPTDPATRTQPWERMAREGDQAWAHFQYYLQQAYPHGPAGEWQPRNVSEMARMVGMSREYLARLSSEFHWPQRAGAWDREVERRKSSQDLAAASRSRRHWLRVVTKARNLGETALDKLLAIENANPAIPSLTAKDIVAVLDWSHKVERVHVAGQEGSEAAPDEGEADLENLELEDLVALDGILKKAKANSPARH